MGAVTQNSKASPLFAGGLWGGGAFGLLFVTPPHPLLNGSGKRE